MIVKLPDGSAWFALPIQPVELSTVWDDKIEGTNIAVGLQEFDTGNDQSSVWAIFETDILPVDGWMGAYTEVKLFITADDISNNALTKINQNR